MGTTKHKGLKNRLMLASFRGGLGHAASASDLRNKSRNERQKAVLLGEVMRLHRFQSTKRLLHDSRKLMEQSEQLRHDSKNLIRESQARRNG